jgi:hypothetical protein
MDRLILFSYLCSLLFAQKTLRKSFALTYALGTVIEKIIIRLLFSFRVRPGRTGGVYKNTNLQESLISQGRSFPGLTILVI